MRRYELTDEQWEAIQGLLPESVTARGRPWRDHRTILNGILWVLFSGAAWRDVPSRYGPWKTVYGRFRRWQDDGSFERILAQLKLKANSEGLLDWSKWLVDSTTAKAHQSASGGRKKN